MNKSRAQWRALVTKIPLHSDNLDKVPQITDGIKNMLRSNPKIFLGKEAPHCFLSRVEGSYAELTIGCNLKHMVNFFSNIPITGGIDHFCFLFIELSPSNTLTSIEKK